MGLQDSINEYAARVDDFANRVGESTSRVEAAVAIVRQEISDLKNVPAGETPDWTPVDNALSHVENAVTELGTAASDVESLEPPTVEEPPAAEETVE